MPTTTPGSIGSGHPQLVGGSAAFGPELDPAIKGAPANGGFPEDMPIDLFGMWRTAAGASLGTSAGATPYIAVVNTSIPVIKWRYDAVAANFVCTSLTVPGQYDPAVDDLRILLCLRKVDAGNTDNNNDLAFQVQPRIWSPGQVDPTLSATAAARAPAGELIDYPGSTASMLGDNALTAATAVARTLNTVPAAAGIRDFAWYEFNLGNQGMAPGDVLILEVGPNELIDGSNSNYVEMCGSMIRWHRNASLNCRQLRTQPVRSFR